MSNGGIFQLITNDGKQDRMLMATELLNRRLKRVAAARRADPSVRDPTPTLADIEKTHVLFMNAHFKPFAAMAYEYNKVRPQSGSAQLGSQIQFSIPQFGDFFNDMALHITLDVPTFSGFLTGDDRDYFRYCDFLGHRLLKKVAFEVNGNPLDEYDSDAMNFHYQFKVPHNKRTAWKRNVGQEVAKEAYVEQPAVVADLNARTTQAFREKRIVLDGPQTPKDPSDVAQVDLWIPLLFWCNQDPRLAIPSVSIPYGQRFINVTLASASEIAATVQRGGTAEGTFSDPNISTCELYINNIFVNPEIHDIYIHRIGFSLIRVHRQQTQNVNKSEDDILLQRMKWPIETLFVGLRPTANLSTMDNWWRMTSCTTASQPTFTERTDGNGTGSTAELELVVKTCAQTIDRLTINAHGIPIYNDIPSQFFNSYTPYTYGGYNITAPEDEGALMIPFNLFPGSYQPSGHINISRAREFYFKYSSSVINSVTTGDLVVVASALNFLLISDGSAVLRYST